MHVWHFVWCQMEFKIKQCWGFKILCILSHRMSCLITASPSKRERPLPSAVCERKNVLFAKTVSICIRNRNKKEQVYSAVHARNTLSLYLLWLELGSLRLHRYGKLLKSLGSLCSSRYNVMNTRLIVPLGIQIQDSESKCGDRFQLSLVSTGRNPPATVPIYPCLLVFPLPAGVSNHARSGQTATVFGIDLDLRLKRAEAVLQ